ncbi:MAG: TolC family protein [Verrucomicrobiota bacterium]
MDSIQKTVIPRLSLLFLGASCFAVVLLEAASAEYDRDGIIRLAYQNNKELAVAVLEVERAASRLEWSGRLENPELGILARGDGIGNDEGESNVEVSFTQRFPLTSKLKHEKNLRRYQVLLAEAEIAEKRRELAGRVDQAIIELLAIEANIELERQLVALNREIVSFLDSQAEQGEISRLDVTQAMLNGRTLEQQLKSLVAQGKQLRHALIHLVGLDADAALEVAESLALPGRPVDKLDLKSVLRRRPDYTLALAKIDQTNAAVILEEAQRWEDLSVRFFVEEEEGFDEPVGINRNTFAGVGFSLPLPLRKRNQDGIAQARIDQESADKELAAARFRIGNELEDASFTRLDRWELAREASGEILQLAQQNLDDFRTAYEQGQAGLLSVQQAQEQVLEIRTASISFVADYHRAAAQWRLVTASYPGLSITQSSK